MCYCQKKHFFFFFSFLTRNLRYREIVQLAEEVGPEMEAGLFDSSVRTTQRFSWARETCGEGVCLIGMVKDEGP